MEEKEKLLHAARTDKPSASLCVCINVYKRAGVNFREETARHVTHAAVSIKAFVMSPQSRNTQPLHRQPPFSVVEKDTEKL